MKRLSPRLYIVVFLATFLPIVYISIIDQTFRLKIDYLPNELTDRKPVTVKPVVKKNDILTLKPLAGSFNRIEKKDDQIKPKPEKHKNEIWKEPKVKDLKADINLKNESRYELKTHTNSSAVLGNKVERKFRLCPLMPKTLGKLLQSTQTIISLDE